MDFQICTSIGFGPASNRSTVLCPGSKRFSADVSGSTKISKNGSAA